MWHLHVEQCNSSDIPCSVDKSRQMHGWSKELKQCHPSLLCCSCMTQGWTKLLYESPVIKARENKWVITY